MHIVGGGELRVRHFIAAEQMLQGRLLTAQDTLAGRQLLQQLTDMLPQGNNRQAVSDYIRSQLGHTVLSQLDAGQPRQVLQSGQLDIPAPQQGHPTLAALSAVLKHPINGEELQVVEQYCQQHFVADSQTPLTSAQVNAVMQYLFIYRLSRTQNQHQTPRCLAAPAGDPSAHRDGTRAAARSALVIGVFVAVVVLAIWLLAH